MCTTTAYTSMPCGHNTALQQSHLCCEGHCEYHMAWQLVHGPASWHSSNDGDESIQGEYHPQVCFHHLQASCQLARCGAQQVYLQAEHQEAVAIGRDAEDVRPSGAAVQVRHPQFRVWRPGHLLPGAVRWTFWFAAWQQVLGMNSSVIVECDQLWCVGGTTDTERLWQCGLQQQTVRSRCGGGRKQLIGMLDPNSHIHIDQQHPPRVQSLRGMRMVNLVAAYIDISQCLMAVCCFRLQKVYLDVPTACAASIVAVVSCTAGQQHTATF